MKTVPVQAECGLIYPHKLMASWLTGSCWKSETQN